MPQVDVDIALDESGDEVVVAKFSDAGWELNVRARAQEFLTLRDIRKMEWTSRVVAMVGAAAGASAFWCSDGDVATS